MRDAGAHLESAVAVKLRTCSPIEQRLAGATRPADARELRAAFTNRADEIATRRICRHFGS